MINTHFMSVSIARLNFLMKEMEPFSTQILHFLVLRKYLVNAKSPLMVQWIKIHLPMQQTLVWFLVQEDSLDLEATKPVFHNYGACMLQLLKPECLESVLHHQKKSHDNEKPTHHNEEQPPLTSTRESLCKSIKDPV